nr:histidine phosphatase family protein [Maliibacterium massiliense]
MTRRLYLIRHGVCTRSGGFVGASDAPLTPEGERQARALARGWPYETPERLFVSPLARARETAAPLEAAWQMRAEVVNGLREMHFGAFEGLTHQQAQRRFGAAFDAWCDSWTAQAPPGGETLAAVQARVLAAWQYIQAQRWQRAAIVAHAGPIRLLQCFFAGKSAACMFDFPAPYAQAVAIALPV